MSKRQTRRSISVAGVTYRRVKLHCDTTSVSVSGFVEQLIACALDTSRITPVANPDPRTQRPLDPEGLVGPSDAERIGYPWCPWCRQRAHYGECDAAALARVDA